MAGVASTPGKRDSLAGKLPEAMWRIKRGEPYRTIADALGCDRKRLYRLRGQMRKIETVLTSVRSGSGYSQAASAAGVAETTARRWCHEHRVYPASLSAKLKNAEKRIERLREERDSARRMASSATARTRPPPGTSDHLAAEVGRLGAVNRKLKRRITELESELAGKLETSRSRINDVRYSEHRA